MTTKIAKYTVFGNPVSHSRSPFIHQQFAQQTNEHMQYDTTQPPIDGFAAAVEAFFANGGQGANVTVPFKEQAFAICQQVSERAQKAGAVNTLIKAANGEIHGDNTDGHGLVTDLLNHNIIIKGAKILLIGAGGAARGVILPLLAEQPQQLVITNRTLSKAQSLANEFKQPNFVATATEQLSAHCFNIIINATSASLSSQVPSIPTQCMTLKTACYDMVYSKQPTPFNHWAEQLGITTTIDGLGMLVEQAAESFRLWRGVKPETQAVLTLLRKTLQKE